MQIGLGLNPLHCEINSWQDFLDLIYHESLVRGKYYEFISVLESGVRPTELQVHTSTGMNEHRSCENGADSQNEVESSGAGARIKTVECASQQNKTLVATLSDAHANSCATVQNMAPGVGKECEGTPR